MKHYIGLVLGLAISVCLVVGKGPSFFFRERFILEFV